MPNPYRYASWAAASVKTILHECSDCGRDFEPLCPFDLYCDECWNTRQEEEDA